MKRSLFCFEEKVGVPGTPGTPGVVGPATESDVTSVSVDL